LLKLYPKDKYPDGHPDLADSFNNLGAALHSLGAFDKALPCYERALALQRRLYPKARYPHGHPDLVRSLTNLGFLLHARGAPARALAYYEEALDAQGGQLDQYLATAPEADALGFLYGMPRTRDSYLSATRDLPAAHAGAYRRVWAGKAALTRLLERRHLAVRVALADPRSDSPLRRTWEELLAARRRLRQALDGPGPDPAAGRPLEQLTDQKERLERELAAALPELARRNELQRLGPDDLGKRLPRCAAVVDLLRYARYEPASNRP
jgi:tetratricopeptide (TPR) repeat protein